MKKHTSLLLLFFIQSLAISNIFAGKFDIEEKVIFPDNSLFIVEHLSRFINENPISRKKYKTFKSYIKKYPYLLFVEYNGYTLAERIEHRSMNHDLDFKIDVFTQWIYQHYFPDRSY